MKSHRLHKPVLSAIKILSIIMLIVSSGITSVASNELDAHFDLLAPIIGGEWVTDLGGMEITMALEPALNGQAVRRISKADGINYFDETIFYWDSSKKGLYFFEVTTRGHTAQASVSIEDGLILFAGELIKDDETITFRNTLEVKADSTLEDKWFTLIDDNWKLEHTTILKKRKTTCCIPPIRGNVNNDALGQVDVSDLVDLVDFIFTNGDTPVCLAEANIDGDIEEKMDMSDVIYIVDFIFTNGPEPSTCT